jgi:hypothetical protein
MMQRSTHQLRNGMTRRVVKIRKHAHGQLAQRLVATRRYEPELFNRVIAATEHHGLIDAATTRSHFKQEGRKKITGPVAAGIGSFGAQYEFNRVVRAAGRRLGWGA